MPAVRGYRTRTLQPLRTATFAAWPDGAQAHLCIVARASWRITPDGLAPHDDAPALVGDTFAGGERDFDGECVRASDFTPFKPRTDVLLVGSAYAPDGKPVNAVAIRFGVGEWSRTMQVAGDRASATTDPVSFTQMPLTWQRAAGSRDNPVGVGADAVANFESGTGPVNPRWRSRAAMRGTRYDDQWVEQRWPGFSDDFDPGFWNAAPASQQLPGYLRGDEPVVLQNLVSFATTWTSQLPGWRVRCAVRSAPPESPDDDAAVQAHDVEMALDTLEFDTDSNTLSLVWRGRIAVESGYARSVRGVFVTRESLATEPATVEAIIASFDDEPDEPVQVTESADGGEPLAQLLTRAPLFGGEEAPAGASEPVRALWNEAAELEQQLVAAGTVATPVNWPGDGSGYAPMPTDAGTDEVFTRIGWTLDMAVHARLVTDDEIEPERASYHTAGRWQPYEPAVSEPAELPPDADLTREDVEAKLAAGEPLAGLNLRGLDLVGLSFDGVSLAESVLSGAALAGCNLVGANLARATLDNCALDGADLTGANLSGADCTGAQLSAADLSHATLDGATFRDASLANATLDGVRARNVVFAGADLTNASAAKASLASAWMDDATLTDANLEGATLTDASLTGATAERVNLHGAKAANLRASNADFRSADLRESDLSGSVWYEATVTGARMAAANLARADFFTADLSAANLDGVDAREGRFILANLTAVSMIQSNLLQAVFEGATLTSANLSGCNCFEAEFLDAAIDGANFTAATLTGTRLAGGV